MKPYRFAIVPLLVLLAALLLSGCVQEKIVYVPVTVTPGGETAATGGEATVPLPPESAPESEPAAPAATAEPAATAAPANGGVAQPAQGNLPPASIGRIAFMGPLGQNSVMQVFVANADATGLTSVSEELGEGYFPTLSPDGAKVAFVSNTSVDPDIYLVDIASGESTNLTAKPGFDNQPVWSPDGSQIAFVTDRDGGDIDIWVMDADGANPRRLARTSGEDKLGGWSPDGTQIVYSNQNEIGESLWVVDVESGETTRLTTQEQGSDTAPKWSPDGELIAYYSAPTSGIPTVYTIRPDGSEQSQVTDGVNPALFPVWSPDSQWLLYTSISGDSRNLAALNVASNEVVNLPDVQGFPTSWAATGELLADTGFSQGPRQSGVQVDPQVLEAAYKKGDPNAPITIVEFSDYQCPFCQRWVSQTYPQMQPFIEDGTVQLIFVDFPLNIHPQAPAASEAARCAGELGGSDAYWMMHDVLFDGLNAWSGQSQPAPIFNQLASQAGLDGKAIQSCVESGRFAADVEAGLREGIRLGVTGTPTFFVNGERLVGAQPWEAFQALIEQQS